MIEHQIDREMARIDAAEREGDAYTEHCFAIRQEFYERRINRSDAANNAYDNLVESLFGDELPIDEIMQHLLQLAATTWLPEPPTDDGVQSRTARAARALGRIVNTAIEKQFRDGFDDWIAEEDKKAAELEADYGGL